MRKVTVILLLFFSSAAWAQQDPLFTHYMYNKLAFNPGYAGSRDLFSMELISRFQWVGIQGAPRTISFTAHTPLQNPHIGLGLNVYRDELGPSVDYGATASFAYRVLFPTSKLSFGVAAGFQYLDIDWSQLNPKDPDDPSLINQPKNKAVPDVDFGIYYYADHFYVGLSSRHLLQNEMVVTSSPDGTNSYTRLMRHFYGMAGVVIPISDNVVFTPSVLCKYVVNTPFQTDVNASFMFHDVLVLGVSYRTDAAIGALVEVNITRNLSLGYSYDIWFNSLKAYNSGSHEIRLGYDFDIFNKSRMLTPRYF